jgi:hypothetical protein
MNGLGKRSMLGAFGPVAAAGTLVGLVAGLVVGVSLRRDRTVFAADGSAPTDAPPPTEGGRQRTRDRRIRRCGAWAGHTP